MRMVASSFPDRLHSHMHQRLVSCITTAGLERYCERHVPLQNFVIAALAPELFYDWPSCNIAARSMKRIGSFRASMEMLARGASARRRRKKYTVREKNRACY